MTPPSSPRALAAPFVPCSAAALSAPMPASCRPAVLSTEWHIKLICPAMHVRARCMAHAVRSHWLSIPTLQDAGDHHPRCGREGGRRLCPALGAERRGGVSAAGGRPPCDLIPKIFSCGLTWPAADDPFWRRAPAERSAAPTPQGAFCVCPSCAPLRPQQKLSSAGPGARREPIFLLLT